MPRAVVEEARRDAAQWRMKARELEETNKANERRMAEVEDREKDELGKAIARAERAERKAAQMQEQRVREEVAIERELPHDVLAGFAGDRAGLESKADQIVQYARDVAEKAVEAAEQAAGRPRRAAELARGAPVAEAPDMNEFIRAGFRSQR